MKIIFTLIVIVFASSAIYIFTGESDKIVKKHIEKKSIVKSNNLDEIPLGTKVVDTMLEVALVELDTKYYPNENMSSNEPISDEEMAKNEVGILKEFEKHSFRNNVNINNLALKNEDFDPNKKLDQ